MDKVVKQCESVLNNKVMSMVYKQNRRTQKEQCIAKFQKRRMILRMWGRTTLTWTAYDNDLLIVSSSHIRSSLYFLSRRCCELVSILDVLLPDIILTVVAAMCNYFNLPW